MHEFEVVATTPLIVFPGNLQGRSIRELGRKGAVMITVEDDRIASPPQPLALDAVRWARVEVDVTGAETDADLHSRLRENLERSWRDDAEGKPLLVRVTLVGATPMHGALTVRREALRADVRAIAVAISDLLWIEKVLLRTAPVIEFHDFDPTVRDALAALLCQGVEDPGLGASLGAELAEFLARTPPDLGVDDELLPDVRRGDLTRLLQEAASALDARLAADAG